jgi:hypothetical protein
LIVNQLSLPAPVQLRTPQGVRGYATLLFIFFVTVLAVHAQTPPPSSAARADEPEAVIIEGVREGDVFGLGRSVRVVGTVKLGVVALGGDVIVEGRVEGDVATVGGNVIQREGSYIGGDVWVLGGTYHHGKTAPGRHPEKTTVMYAGYEQELRNMMRDPTTLLTPRWSAAYVGQRLLSVLFWFVVALALSAIAPGAVSRAAARLQLTSLRVSLIGFLGAIVSSFGVLACLWVMPTAISVLIGIMALLLLVMSILFGRVVIYAATGRWLQRRFFPEGKRSETIALLLGAGFWTLILSLPYIWPLVACGMMVVSLGLALTGRYQFNWRRERAA